MAVPQERDPLVDLERHRQSLEETVNKLRKALKTWHTWELEYETLKEEIQHANFPSPEAMLSIGRNLGGTLINEKEVEQLISANSSTKRNATQVVDLISRRVNIVQQNITSTEKLLQANERNLNAATVLLEPDLDNEEGLPLTDIVEELDDEGNVISSSVNAPGKSAAGIMEALQKAGIPGFENANPPTDAPEKNNSTEATSSDAAPAPTAASSSTKAPILNSASDIAAFGSGVKPPKSSPKKSVSFSEDTKPDSSNDRSASFNTAGYNPDLTDFTFNRGKKVIEVDENDDVLAEYPVIPDDESPEDAALRRQMLQYGLSEVGQVVAEIDLEEGMEYSDDDDDDDHDEDEFNSDESEEEDEYGRSIRPMITPKLRAEMEALEKKLNAQMIENLGPRPDTNNLAGYAEDVRRLVVKDEVIAEETKEEEKKQAEPQAEKSDTKKKAVRFAEDLDISAALAPAEPQPSASKSAASRASPMSDNILERPPPTISDTIVERAPSSATPQSTSASKPAKVSRFKTARTTPNGNTTNAESPSTTAGPPKSSPFPLFPQVPAQPPTPSGPPGMTLSPAVIEHAPPPTVDPSNIPDEPDEFNTPEHRKEIEAAYNKARDQLLKKGLLPSTGVEEVEDGEEEPELVEDTGDGKVKKVSRFRAARLKGA